MLYVLDVIFLQSPTEEKDLRALCVRRDFPSIANRRERFTCFMCSPTEEKDVIFLQSPTEEKDLRALCVGRDFPSIANRRERFTCFMCWT